MNEKIKNLERDPKGHLLPTLRNKDIMEEIMKGCGNNYDKIIKAVGKELYLKYTMAVFFDPRKKNVVWSTKEGAIKGMERTRFINKYDRKYVEEKYFSDEKKFKMLIFESDIMLAKTYTSKLYQAGFIGLVFQNYKNVINNVLRLKPDILYCRIIISGKMNGLEAIKILKRDERTKNIPIIAIDNLGEKEDRKKILEAGADLYLVLAQHKPLELARIFKNCLIKKGKLR